MVYLYRTDIAPERLGLTLATVNQSLKILQKINKTECLLYTYE
jgi:hypothetical protein